MKQLSRDFSTDGKAVFCNGKAIPNSDPDTFNIPLDSIYFAYDKNQLYALSSSAEGLQIWTDVDIESLEFFAPEIKYQGKKGEDLFLQSGTYFTDKNHLFKFNWHFIEYVNPQGYPQLQAELQERKPNSDAWWNWSDEYYKSLKHISKNIYSDGSKIFFYFETGQYFDYPFSFGLGELISYFSVIPGVEIDTLQILEGNYLKDQNKVYHLTRKITADTSTFEVIQEDFAKDKNGVWYNGYYCKEDIDLASFEIIRLEAGVYKYYFAKDEKAVYSTQRSTRIGKYKGYSDLLVKLKKSDPQSFEVINHIWAKDKNNVYCDGRIWSIIDPGTFEFLFVVKDRDTSFAKDKNSLFNTNGRRVVKGIDGQSFVMLNEHWGKDKNVVFNFRTERIAKNLDVKTFEVPAEDKTSDQENPE